MIGRRGKFALLAAVGAAFAMQIAATASAWACDGQVGKVIFEDHFADDMGGWDLTPPETTVAPPNFLMAPDSKNAGISAQNLTFFATDGDYCLEAVLPPPAAAADGGKDIGIELWATDYNNFMEAHLGADASVTMESKRAGKWNTIFTVPAKSAFKSDPGAVNSLRVVAKNGVLTVFVNGTQIRGVRAQVPEGDLRFGIYGEFLDFHKAADGTPPILIKSYKVTSGE